MTDLATDTLCATDIHLNEAPSGMNGTPSVFWRLASRAMGRDTAHRPCTDLSADRVFHLDARFAAAGAWAGVDQLTEAAYLDLLQIGRDDLVQQHSHELYTVLWRHRDIIHPEHLCLTDISTGAERTRFYALDRAYRLIHGLVGLVLHWKRLAGEAQSWTIVAHGFDGAQHLGARFFAELARRGKNSDIDVIVQTRPDWQDVELAKLYVRAEPTTTSFEMSTGQAAASDPARDLATATRWTEDRSDEDLEHTHTRLLSHFRGAGDHLEAARIGLKMLALYVRRGYYYEARSFLDAALPYLDEIVGADEVARINHISAINSCLVMTDDPTRALEVIERFAAPHLTRPHCLANMNYILAMHHLRYAEARDIELAERYILQAVDNIRAAANSAETQLDPFLEAFIGNGLAFLRVRQGRPLEAIELCGSGYDRLVKELVDDRHLLHRSVLQYNIAQVHVMLGRLEEGLGYYRAAIDMDPHYSEYHNETGNILQKLERYDDAAESYASAIMCSAPYPEVFFNKAVCHTRQERWEDALRFFAESLELNPDQPEIFALRAEVLERLGSTDEALEEYDRAIDLGYNSVAARVNRAVLHYNNGAFRLALVDMDHVIGQDAGEAAHYENRAAIYQALDRSDRQREDLAMAERCREVVQT